MLLFNMEFSYDFILKHIIFGVFVLPPDEENSKKDAKEYTKMNSCTPSAEERMDSVHCLPPKLFLRTHSLMVRFESRVILKFWTKKKFKKIS